MEPSYAILDGLVFGRFSFNGFNQQVEVIYILELKINNKQTMKTFFKIKKIKIF